jgi:hypothetical protein
LQAEQILDCNELQKLAREVEAGGQQSDDALGELQLIGPNAKNTVPVLVRLLQRIQEDPTLLQAYNRREIIKTLGRIGPGAAAAAPALIQLLDEDDPFTAIDAAFALEWIGPTISSELAACIAERHKRVGGIQLASQALSHMGVRPRCIAWSVSAGLNDRRCLVRQYAAETLGQIAPDMTVLPVLLLALCDQDQDVRDAASRAVTQVLFRGLFSSKR